MALHFVSTSVLSSSEGGGFSEEVKESEDIRLAKVAAEKSASRPLYEQLAEQAVKKQAEYDANTKLLFAQKTMDEEDIRYYERLNELKAKEEQDRLKREEKEIDSFLHAQHVENTPKPQFVLPKDETKKVTNISKIEVVKHKRKKDHHNNSSSNSPAPAAITVEHKLKSPRVEITPIPQPTPPPTSSVSGPMMSLFGQYESDEET